MLKSPNANITQTLASTTSPNSGNAVDSYLLIGSTTTGCIVPKLSWDASNNLIKVTIDDTTSDSTIASCTTSPIVAGIHLPAINSNSGGSFPTNFIN